MAQLPDDARPYGTASPNPAGLLLALELMELGIELTRQRLVRENTGVATDRINEMLRVWIMTPRHHMYSGNK